MSNIRAPSHKRRVERITDCPELRQLHSPIDALFHPGTSWAPRLCFLYLCVAVGLACPPPVNIHYRHRDTWRACDMQNAAKPQPVTSSLPRSSSAAARKPGSPPTSSTSADLEISAIAQLSSQLVHQATPGRYEPHSPAATDTTALHKKLLWMPKMSCVMLGN